MENKNLRKRLYQNLSQRPLKHTFLLECEMKDPKSPQGILKPKILQQSNTSELKNLSNSLLLHNTILNKQLASSDIKLRPQKVQIQKLSKEGKSLIEDGKNKMRSNLKPNEIFSFYDSFPEMMEDFFYLNRVSHPYDYQIVSYAKRNPHEYMTISSQGVTLYHQKEAQFLTRQEWLEDEKTYHKLQKIDFFNQYKLSKNFTIWKNKMKRHYMKSMSNILSEKLFLTYEYPRKCLREVKQISLNLEQSLPLFPSDYINSTTWEQLLDISNKYHTGNLIVKIENEEKRIIKCLEDAIDLEIKNFKQNNKIKIQGLNSKEQNKQGYIYSQQAILRKQYKRVLKLIKLGESVLLQSKIQLIKRWLEQISEKLKQVNQKRLRDEWFVITFVAILPEKTSAQFEWSPCKQNFLNTFKIIIDRAIGIICQKHEKIMNNQIFQKYRNSQDLSIIKEDKYNLLKNLIEQSDFYKKLVDEIKERMSSEYEQVLNQQNILNNIKEIYQKHNQDSQPLQQRIYNSSVEDIRQLVDEWEQKNETMHNLPNPDKFDGMVKFDYTKIKNSMIVVTRNFFTELFSILPIHLAKKCQQTENLTKSILGPISTVVDDQKFVEFTKAVRTASGYLEQIIGKGKQIKQLQRLIRKNKISIPEHLRSSIKKLEKDFIEELIKKVNEAESQQDKRLNQFKKNTEEKIKKIKSSIKEYWTKLQGIQMEQKNMCHNPNSIIQRILIIQSNIADLDKQAIHINNVENQLGLNQTDFTESHDLYIRVRYLHSLWNMKKQWVLYIRELQQKHYLQLQCEAELEKWNEFNTQILKINKVLEQNQFLHKLYNEIMEVQIEIKMVKLMQSKFLNQKSWNEITQYLSYQFQRKDNLEAENLSRQDTDQNIEPFKNYKDEIYTLEWFRTNKIYVYSEKIQQIVKKSERENHLTNTLSVLKTYINTLNLEVITKKKQLIILGENTTIMRELQENLACLIQIFNYEYSDHLKKETKLLVKHYEYVIQILESCQDFCTNWEKYEQLLDPSRNSKQLNKEFKDFTNLKEAYKKIIKNMPLQNWSKRVYDETTGANPTKTTIKNIQKANVLWEQIKKGVEEYLDGRRSNFYYFFYFSDDQLINLLTKFDCCSNINSLVPVIYENIKEINLVDRENENFNSFVVVNNDGQELKVNRFILAKTASQFQQLLKSCEEAWKKLLLSSIKTLCNDFIYVKENQIPRRKIISENITQVILAFQYIIWVKLAQCTYLNEESSGFLPKWIIVQNEYISEMKKILEDCSTPVERKKVTQILIQAIYLRDKSQHFIQTQTESLDSYEWQRTLKLNFESIVSVANGEKKDGEKIFLQAHGANLMYAGQYTGPSCHQYIAPETERSYLNLIQLIHNKQIGVINSDLSNIETIKSFSHLLAQNFKSFTLCTGINLKMIDRIITGASLQGIWACFTPPSDWEIISFLASHLSAIQKPLKDQTPNTQTNKYECAFFLRVLETDLKYVQNLSKMKYRPISFVTPHLKTLLSIKNFNDDKDSQLFDIIIKLTEYCEQIFKQSSYEEFSLRFAQKILSEFKQKYNDNKQNCGKKIAEIIERLLIPRLKFEDRALLRSLLQAYNLNAEQLKIKVKKAQSIDYPENSNLDIERTLNNKYGDQVVKDSISLYQIINQNWSQNKNIVIVGLPFSGKSSIIQSVRDYISIKQHRQIKLHNIYFEAYKDSELISPNDKGYGIIPKCFEEEKENWIILDGPLNEKYLRLFGKISTQTAFSSYGVITDRQIERKIRFFLQTTNLSKISPDFIYHHSVLYIDENQKRIQQIVRNSIKNFTYKIYEQEVRMETKGDQNNQHEVKTYKAKLKHVELIKESIQLLISQITGFIERLTSKGSLKIKSVEFLYQISSSQLAYRCTKLVQCVFIQNWDSIKQKINNRTIEKFAAWVVLWSVGTIINPQDRQKFIKVFSEIVRSNIYDDLLYSIVFPGNGLEIFALNSQRVQSALSFIPNLGNITNIVNKYNSLFDGETINKNKFQSEFYFDEPNKIRVVTEESAYFTYFSLINRHNNTPMAIYGPPSSGKKSIIDIFNKLHQQSIDTFSVRFKKQDPFYISQQIQKPFTKFLCLNKTFFRPNDISKRIHVSVDDVSMTPLFLPSTQFLRMLANTNSIFDEKSKLIHFRQLLFSMTINQIKTSNLEQIDFRRTLSRFFILQTNRITKEKLTSIFTPILDNLLHEFESSQNLQNSRLFINERDQNIIVSATVSIYSFIQDQVNKLTCNNLIERNKKLLASPRIQQICHVVKNICSIQQRNNKEFYAELWAHEVLRVFGDKLGAMPMSDALFKQIQRHSLLNFKSTILNKTLLFTNLCPLNSQDSKEPKYPYRKCEDLSQIEKQIQQIYQKQSTCLSAPLITDQFIVQLIRIYRVLKMPAGHLLIATPFKKAAKFLVKLTSFLTKSTVYHDLQSSDLDFDTHIAPSIIKDIGCSLILDIQNVKYETLYQLTCLINQNIFQFSISPEIKQKIKHKFVTIAQENLYRQNYTNTGKLKSSSFNDSLQTLRLQEINNKIEQDFSQIIIECFTQFMHVAICLPPHKICTSKFLSQNASLVKNMQVYWYDFKDQTVYKVAQRMMEQLYDPTDYRDQNQIFISKCKRIYEVLSEQQKSDVDFLKFLGNCSKTYDMTVEQAEQKITEYKQCLKVLIENLNKIEEKKKISKQIQQKIEELVKNQEQINRRTNKMQENGEQPAKELQIQMKKIKAEKDSLDIKSRQSRTSQKISEDFSQLLPQKEELQRKIAQATDLKSKSQQYSILVQSALFYLNNANKYQYLQQFNKWMQLLGLRHVEDIKDIIQIFQKIYGIQYLKVPGWQKETLFTQLKGFHFCQNFMSIPESVFGTEPIVVNDDQQVLARLLSNLSDKNPSINAYSNCKLLTYISFEKDHPQKRNLNAKALRQQVFSIMQKEIDKCATEIKRQDNREEQKDEKLEFGKNIIIIGKNYKWKPSRNDIDVFQKKILKQRKILIQNRVIIQGKTSPNITFHSQTEDLKNKLVQKSIKMEFGQPVIIQSKRLQTSLRQLNIKQTRRKQELIKACCLNQSPEKILVVLEKINTQLTQLDKNRKKIEQSAEEKIKCTDLFIIQWIFTTISSVDALQSSSRVLQIFEFIKKCFLEINYSRQQKIARIEQIEEDILKNWQNLLKANISSDPKMETPNLIKFLIPLQQTHNLIIVPYKPHVQLQIDQILSKCNYSKCFVDIHLHIYHQNNTHHTHEQHQFEPDSKIVWVFQNFNPQNQLHVNSFIEHYQKNKRNYAPISILITNNCSSARQNSILGERFRIIERGIEPKVRDLYSELIQITKQDPRQKKLQQTQQIQFQSLTLSQTQMNEQNKQSMSKIREGIIKFLIIYLNTSNRSISLKTLSSVIEYVKKPEEAFKLLSDFLPNLPQGSESLLMDLFYNLNTSPEKHRQIQKLFAKCSQELKNNQRNYKEQKKRQKRKIQLLNSEQIQEIINQLPFSLNLQDIPETTEPFNIWLLSVASKFNEKKFLFKKHLQQCLKISTGNKNNYWTPHSQFGFEVPTKDQISRINNEYKIIKKGLELVGLSSSKDTSSKDIKLMSNFSSTVQNQSLMTLASVCIDCKNLSGFSEKIILIAMIRASKKLKVPLSRLKTVWRVVNSECMVEQPVIGQNCIGLQARIIKPEILGQIKKQEANAKLIIMIFDPTPISTTMVPQKLNSKKEKQIKLKQQQIKPINNESQVPSIGISIKLSNGKVIGSIACQSEQRKQQNKQQRKQKKKQVKTQEKKQQNKQIIYSLKKCEIIMEEPSYLLY